jgi:hypothetical protein
MPSLLGTVPYAFLDGLGAASPLDTFLLAHPTPNSGQVSDLLKAFPPEQRAGVAQDLIARGVSPSTISLALSWNEARDKISWPKVWGVLSIASAAAGAYHGYKRNQSIGWSVWWFFMGSLFPVFTPAVALAQGFGRPKKS